MKKLLLFFILYVASQSVLLTAMTAQFRFNEDTPGLEDIDAVFIMPRWNNSLLVLQLGQVENIDLPSLGSALEADIFYTTQDEPAGYTYFSFTPVNDETLYDIPAMAVDHSDANLMEQLHSELERRLEILQQNIIDMEAQIAAQQQQIAAQQQQIAAYEQQIATTEQQHPNQ